MTTVKLTRAASREQRVQRVGRPLPGVARGALARGGAQARAQRVVAADAQQRVGERAGVAGRHAQRGVAERLGEHGEVGDDAGVPCAAASSGGRPKPSSYDGATTASAPA